MTKLPAIPDIDASNPKNVQSVLEAMKEMLEIMIARRGTDISLQVLFDKGWLNQGVKTNSEPVFEMVRQGAVWHAYGGFEGQGETIACGVGDWNHITNGANDLWTLDEADGISISGDVFTINNTGDYIGNLSVSISGLNTKDFHVRIYNITQASVAGRAIGVSTTGANNEVNVAVPIYIEGTAGDEIRFEIMSADGTDPVVDDGLFFMTYLHD